MSTKIVQRVVFALVVVLLLLASYFAGQMYSPPMNVQAQEEPEDENRAISYHDCLVTQVAMYENRAHILCNTPKDVGGTDIWFFAVADTPANKTFINRVLAIGLTNMSMNRQVRVVFDTLASSNPPSCWTGDCRKLVGIVGLD